MPALQGASSRFYVFRIVRYDKDAPKGKKNKNRGIVIKCSCNIKAKKGSKHSRYAASGTKQARQLVERAFQTDACDTVENIVCYGDRENNGGIFGDFLCAILQIPTSILNLVVHYTTK